MNIYRKIIFTITILLSSIFFSNIVYGKYIFNEELQAYDLTVRNFETNIRNFTIQNDEGLNYKILDGDKVVAENEVINSNDFEFDKQYKLEIYNNTKNVYILDINTEGTEINTFSKYVSIDVSADSSNANISKIYNGKFLSAANKKIIAINSFTPAEEPLIYYFTISTKYVKMNLEQYPERIGNDSNLNLNFIISATFPSWDISETEDDNVTARLYNNTLEITGTGNMYYDILPWKDYRDYIKNVIIDEGVTNIYNEAFLNCTSLTSIIIPNSVTSIGNNAFENCTSLTSIIIPNSVTSIGNGAFDNCTSLTSIIIPNSVTKIGERAFYNWTSEQTIYCDFYSQPDTWDSYWNYYCNANIVWKNMSWDISATEDDNVIATIYGNTLKITGTGNMIDFTSSTIPWADYQSSITDVEILSGVKNISDYSFYGGSLLTNIDIPESVTSIGNLAFAECTSLTSINIPESVTSTGMGVFYECTSLTSIDIPESVTSIGDLAFTGCTSLTSINVPNNLTSIGEAAFENCTSLTNINIPESVTSIGEAAFQNCTSLTSINVPNNLTSIGKYVFQKCTNLKEIIGLENTKVISIPNQLFIDCSSLTSINMPNSVTSIGTNAFSRCTSLASIDMSDNLISIGINAFGECTSLTSINIPKSVTSIGDRAFQNCTSLTSINIPESVTSIGEYAFANWTSSQTIYFSFYVPLDTWDVYWGYNCNANIVWKVDEVSAISNNIQVSNLEEKIETVDIYSQDKSVNIYSNDINMENSDASEMPEDVLNENEVNIYSES